MSKIKDEQFSAEVEKRLQNLFNDSDETQLGKPSDVGGDGTISSEDDLLYAISEEDLLKDVSYEEDSLEEILEEDLLDDDLTESVLDDDLSENLLDDHFNENVLDDDLSEDLLDDDFNENELDDDLSENFLDDDLGEDLLDNSSDKPIKTENEDVSIKEEGEFHFYPFRLLKSIILSIDWEITDDIMDRFVNQVTGLMETYKDDRFVLIFLHLLWELGKYIKKHRGQSHPNSIKTLNSVYNALERILSSKDLSDADKKKILSTEMIKFKTLKEQITLQQVDPSEKAVIAQTNVAEKAEEEIAEKSISNEMTEIIRAVVRAELKAFIKEFAVWANKRE